MKTLVTFFNMPKLSSFRLVVAVIVLFSLVATPMQSPVMAQGVGCSASSPISQAYTVTICIPSPTNGAVLTGETSVTATVSVTGTNPGIQKLIFYLGGQYLLTDYASPYTFTLPTTKFVDGSRILDVEAKMRDGFTSSRAAINVTFNNGVTQQPVNTNTYSIAAGSTPQPGRPFVIAAMGDGASGEPNAVAVEDLIASWNPNMFLYLGDVYNEGTFTEFYNWYGSGSDHLSRLRPITNPAVGNHEYQGLAAPGYFDYWNNVPHYYSFNAAGWHVINLDSTSQFNQTTPGTAQYDWLLQDLNNNNAACKIAYFHHPLYNVGAEGEATRMSGIWALLAQYGVDVVLTGHDHDYQRWYAMNGQGQRSPNGMTQFVVGTGGHGIQDFIKTDSRMAVGFDTPPSAFGALRMELNESGAAYQFVNIQGLVLDSGSIPCNASPDATPPNAPSNLNATSTASTHVDLSWTSATDNVGVTNYEIYRNGTLLATTGAVTNYSDSTVTGGTTYQYQIRARDAAGNVSGFSNVATTLTASFLFSDGFESGNLSKWTSVTGLTVQQQEVYDGAYAARQTSIAPATWAYKQLSTIQNTLYYRLRFKIMSMASNVYLLKFRTVTGTSLLGVYVGSNGKLAYRNDVNSTTSNSTTDVTTGVWHDLQTRITINGSASQTEVWLDGLRITALSKIEALGSTPVGRLQLGDNTTGRTYDVALDNVVVDTNPIDMTPPSVTVTEPANNAQVRASVSVNANASDNTTLDRVEFFANGTLIGTDYLAPYTMIWDSTTVSDGPTTLTARAVDSGLNSTTSTGHIVMVDNTAPNATINSGPSGTVNSSSATFTFSSNEPVTYICFIDAEEVEDCSSPQTLNNLSNGSHTFQVTATDATGNNDPTPASRTWIVDSGAPTATATLTRTPTITPTNTNSPTSTVTPTPTNTSTPTATPTQPGQLFTVTPMADAYVNESKPSTNYGTASALRLDGSPIERSYMRFSVQSISNPILRATLRVFANNSSNAGYTVSSITNNTWGEVTINYNNVPPMGGAIGSSGAVTSGTWTSVDVTPYITGNGTYSLVLTTSSSTVINLTSRESGANAPQLIIETQATPTSTASATNIAFNTPTLTPSPTLGATVTPSNTPTTTLTPTATLTPSNSPTPTTTFTPTSTLAVNILTFNPAADSYVNESSPNMNYGTATSIRADASPIVRSYLRFDVQGLSGLVTRATLQVFTNSSSNTGYEVRRVADNSWGELTINYANAPSFDGVTVTSGSFATGIWTTVDITPLVTGNGTFSIALTTTSTTAFSLVSREAAANAPQLIIETTP